MLDQTFPSAGRSAGCQNRDAPFQPGVSHAQYLRRNRRHPDPSIQRQAHRARWFRKTGTPASATRTMATSLKSWFWTHANRGRGRCNRLLEPPLARPCRHAPVRNQTRQLRTRTPLPGLFHTPAIPLAVVRQALPSGCLHVGGCSRIATLSSADVAILRRSADQAAADAAPRKAPARR